MTKMILHIKLKGGKYLEALAQADTIVFDKTGTLTRATPQVVQVVPFSGCGEHLHRRPPAPGGGTGAA